MDGVGDENAEVGHVDRHLTAARSKFIVVRPLRIMSANAVHAPDRMRVIPGSALNGKHSMAVEAAVAAKMQVSGSRIVI